MGWEMYSETVNKIKESTNFLSVWQTFEGLLPGSNYRTPLST